MLYDKGSKARLAKRHATHNSGNKGIQALTATFVSILNMIIDYRFPNQN